MTSVILHNLPKDCILQYLSQEDHVTDRGLILSVYDSPLMGPKHYAFTFLRFDAYTLYDSIWNYMGIREYFKTESIIINSANDIVVPYAMLPEGIVIQAFFMKEDGQQISHYPDTFSMGIVSLGGVLSLVNALVLALRSYNAMTF